MGEGARKNMQFSCRDSKYELFVENIQSNNL